MHNISRVVWLVIEVAHVCVRVCVRVCVCGCMHALVYVTFFELKNWQNFVEYERINQINE